MEWMAQQSNAENEETILKRINWGEREFYSKDMNGFSFIKINPKRKACTAQESNFFSNNKPTVLVLLIRILAVNGFLSAKKYSDSD